MKKAVILVSGGLDSATCLALAKSKGFQCYALSFSYGQRHSAELVAAQRVAQAVGVVDHKIITLDVSLFANSALTNTDLDVPEYQESSDIPVTYVPARNTIFLALALGFAESIGAQAIFIGASSIDYSHYPDCRPEFIEAFQNVANLGTKAAVEGSPIKIVAPLQYLSKIETIQLGIQLGVDYSLTVSCYQANAAGQACGTCDSCTFRKKGFIGAGVADPTVYQEF
ncbi:MAG: 7-cyano-7-deazaguanine synthase QueC [Legionella sp.]|jgi:7-cyano-7-deazaguanine synthase